MTDTTKDSDLTGEVPVEGPPRQQLRFSNCAAAMPEGKIGPIDERSTTEMMFDRDGCLSKDGN
jgi:hypothetical protein